MLLPMKGFSFVFVTLLLISLLGCAGGTKQASTGEFIDDAAITGKVKAALIKDPVVKAIDINVETFKGVVQLSGFANSQTEVEKAIQLARNVEGVKSVKNDMRLKGAS